MDVALGLLSSHKDSFFCQQGKTSDFIQLGNVYKICPPPKKNKSWECGSVSLALGEENWANNQIKDIQSHFQRQRKLLKD